MKNISLACDWSKGWPHWVNFHDNPRKQKHIFVGVVFCCLSLDWDTVFIFSHLRVSWVLVLMVPVCSSENNLSLENLSKWKYIETMWDSSGVGLKERPLLNIAICSWVTITIDKFCGIRTSIVLLFRLVFSTEFNKQLLLRMLGFKIWLLNVILTGSMIVKGVDILVGWVLFSISLYE